jgi:hypothetical protein
MITKKRILFILIPLLVLATLFGILVLIISIPGDVYTNTNEISDIIGSLQPKVIKLENIAIKAQPDSTSCGITTVTVASNYFNNANYEVTDLIEKYLSSKGSSSGGDMKEWLQQEMPGRTITYKAGVKNGEMLGDIHASLNNDNPVVIIFGALNPYNEPYYDFHASVVYGIDLDSETKTIANSYGYSEEISLVDFLNKMSYTETGKYPFFQKISIKFFQPKNAYYLIT